MSNKELVLAFCFTAAEFLEEELEELEEKFPGFTKSGKYVFNEKEKYKHEWWCTKDWAEKINKFFKWRYK